MIASSASCRENTNTRGPAKQLCRRYRWFAGIHGTLCPFRYLVMRTIDSLIQLAGISRTNPRRSARGKVARSSRVVFVCARACSRTCSNVYGRCIENVCIPPGESKIYANELAHSRHIRAILFAIVYVRVLARLARTRSNGGPCVCDSVIDALVHIDA